MGNVKSELYNENSVDPWWPTTTEPVPNKTNEEFIEEIRLKRHKIIAEKRQEMNNLREEVAKYKKENEELRKKLVEDKNSVFEVPGSETSDLQNQLDKANSEIATFEVERQEYKTHVAALKDIVTVSKQLLLIKENQIKELSQQLEDVQKALADKELQVLSDDVRKEYEKQLNGIRQLKLLYEERQGAVKKENSELKTKLNEANVDLNALNTKTTELQERIDTLEKETGDKTDQIFNLESQLGLSKADCKELQAQLNVINQTLTTFNNGQEIDLDKLCKTLEENHDLLTDIVSNEECNQTSSALPKVLLDLVNQINGTNPQEEDEAVPTATEPQTLNSASAIVENLPKVWRVLIELLSHQSAPVSVLNENDPNSCYKSVQTPAGPTLVLSVSKTFIRLKNLIVEKKSLEKETTRLKQLNSHLETRLQDQEKRLEMVSQEVAKTWHVVGKMQKQHQMLHTQENILRYELAQKRKLLNELKEELEYCRDKWMQAREKNSVTEKQWKELQLEFASRKRLAEDFGSSVESGYSDDRESSNSDSDEESTQAEKPQNILKVVQEEIENIESTKTKHDDIKDTYKKLEEHILETIKKTQTEEYASTPLPPVFKPEVKIVEEEVVESHSKEETTADAILSKREERLRRLEEEAKQLVGIVSKNANRGVAFCSKLNLLHDRYGASSSSSNAADQSTNKEEEEGEEVSQEKTD